MRTVDPTLLALVQAGEASRGFAFRFSISAVTDAVWCYTSIRRGVTLNTGTGAAAETYTAAAIKADQREGSDSKPDLTQFIIELERKEPFIEWCDPRLGLLIEVTVYEVWFAADGTAYPDHVADGHCIGIERAAGKVKTTWKPLHAWLSKRIPTANFSTRDVRVPWTGSFEANRELYAIESTVSSIDQNVIYSSAAAVKDTGKCSRGFIEYVRTLQSRSITIRVPLINNIAEAPARFVCAYPPPLLAATETFTAYEGYDGTRDRAIKLGVLDGMIAFPDMPYQNPIFVPQA